MAIDPRLTTQQYDEYERQGMDMAGYEPGKTPLRGKTNAPSGSSAPTPVAGTTPLRGKTNAPSGTAVTGGPQPGTTPAASSTEQTTGPVYDPDMYGAGEGGYLPGTAAPGGGGNGALGSGDVIKQGTKRSALDEWGSDKAEQTEDQEKYIRDKGTVQGQLDTILKSDSALMKQAEARGRAESQARGWSDSSAGIAAEKASMINTALPIAQQDAATYSRFAENEQNKDIATDMLTYQSNLSTVMNQMNINAAEKSAVMGMFGQLSNTYMGMINQLNQNTSVTPEDKTKAQELFKNQFQNFGNLYTMFAGMDMNWSA